MSKKLNVFDRITLVLNCLAAIALLCCYLAPFIYTANFWPEAFFSMAYIPLLIVNALFVIGWLFRRQKFALLSLTSIFAGSLLMLRNIGFHRPEYRVTKVLPDCIRVMTYNVCDFLDHQPGASRDSHIEMVHLIKRQAPDIITMQEFLTRNHERFAIKDSICKVLGGGSFWFKAYSATPFDSTGLVIFSRYPIIDHDTIPMPYGMKTEGIYADFKKNGVIFRIYNVHLQSTQFDKEENQYLDSLPFKDNPDLHRSKNIALKLKKAFLLRGQQALAVKQELNACKYPYIIAGDFNDTPLSFSVNYIGAGLKNAFLERGYGFGVTYYGEFPGFQIDYIMVTRQFNVLNYKILHERLSDHYPVLSDLKLQ